MSALLVVVLALLLVPSLNHMGVGATRRPCLLLLLLLLPLLLFVPRAAVSGVGNFKDDNWYFPPTRVMRGKSMIS